MQALVHSPIEAPKILDTKTTLQKGKPNVQLHWIPKPVVSLTKLSEQIAPPTTTPTIMVPKLHDMSSFARTLAPTPKYLPSSHSSSKILTPVPNRALLLQKNLFNKTLFC